MADRVIVFERMGCLQLFYISLFGKNDRIYYFSISDNAANLFGFLKIRKPEKIDFYFSDLTEGGGESLYCRVIVRDLHDISEKIKKDILIKSQFLRKWAGDIVEDFDKVLIYMQKKIVPDVKKIVVFINVIEAYLKEGKIIVPKKELVFVGRKEFFNSVLQEYAYDKNIRLKNCTIDISSFIKNTGAVFFYIFVSPCKDILKKFSKRKKNKRFNNSSGKNLIAALYTGREPSLNNVKRSEFFWIKGSTLSPQDILLCFPCLGENLKITKKTIEEYKASGINFMALSEHAAGFFDMPVWYSTISRYAMLFKLNLKVLWYFLRTLCAERNNFLYLRHLLCFNQQYAFWFDLFRHLNIKANINPPDYETFSIPMHVALKNSGGISISYQVADFDVPDLGYSSCSDVFFSFGPYYAERLKDSGFASESLIYSGYLTDYVFDLVKESADVLRKKLTNKGARFIVSYFDEFSSHGRMSIVKNQTASEAYRRFFEKVISDKEFGLICKPKKPKTLRERIKDVSDLMEEAEKTGRCVFLEEGSYISSSYVSEAAQASDLVIGLLIGGTTIFESYLSGIPGFYLDLERLYSFDKYKHGKDIFIFDTLDKLFDAIDRFKIERDKDKKIELLGKVMAGKDPFRDGRAVNRFTDYIKDLLGSFNSGNNRELCIKSANHNYRKISGAKYVCDREENCLKWD